MQKTAGACGGRDDGESAREPPRRPDWIPDELVLACPKCDAHFSPIVRRHHCRVCGGVFCSSCTSFKAIIPRLLYNDPVRVCKQCHLKCSAAASIEKAIMSQDYDALLSSLCSLGADANFTITHEPPMVLAASRGDLRSIRILADRGADVCVSSDGNEVIDQPLICAVENGHLDSVKLLLQLGAANSGYPRRVSDGNTVLHISVLNGDIAMCRFFTQLGVDVHATNNRGATPAEIGKSRHNAEVAAALGGPPAPSAPTLYSKGAKCLTIEWMPVPHVDSGRVIYEVQCCTDDGVWRLVARSVRGNTVKIRNLVEGKSYKFRLRCCFSSKEEKGPSSSMSLRDDAVDAEQLHWSAFGPPSDDFKVPADAASDSWNPLAAVWNSLPNSH